MLIDNNTEVVKITYCRLCLSLLLLLCAAAVAAVAGVAAKARVPVSERAVLAVAAPHQLKLPLRSPHPWFHQASPAAGGVVVK